MALVALPLLLMLTVLVVALMGRRGLGGDGRGKRERQSGEKIFHLCLLKKNVDQERERGGGGSNCGGMPSSAATGAAISSARGGRIGVVKPASTAGTPAQAIMQSIEP